MSTKISNSVIRRLPRYYRFLGELQKLKMTRISSRELSERMGLTASQIRQDLNCFGGFGQQGYGYNIDLLRSEIGQILGLDKPQSAILIGVGNLGRAIAQHINFESTGFHLVGLFDSKEALVGQVVRNLPIRNISTIDEFCRENLPTVAILCIPKESAQSISAQLVKLGIKGFWNFSHYDLALNYPDIVVENMHFGDSLMTLSYRLQGSTDTNEE
ncbi:MAG: redox-sensing transcriptional repressor Rex [Oscillospiraceae bacterium]|nr:redox-sensing transcriptional repressor Rex [Oscillospiraceae bacterium]